MIYLCSAMDDFVRHDFYINGMSVYVFDDIYKYPSWIYNIHTNYRSGYYDDKERNVNEKLNYKFVNIDTSFYLMMCRGITTRLTVPYLLKEL